MGYTLLLTIGSLIILLFSLGIYLKGLKRIEKIQQKLYDLGYTSQLVTGYYGDITFNNVAYFQIVNNLTVTNSQFTFAFQFPTGKGCCLAF